MIGSRSVVLQRRLKIAEFVRREGEMRVEELSHMLGVSAVTIRNDLTYLEEQGVIFRSAGKAMVLRSSTAPAGSLPGSLPRAQLAPLLEGARSLLGADQTVLLGSGPIPQQIIPLLADLPGLTLRLTAVDALPIARAFLDCPIQITGGEVAEDGVSLAGPLAVQALQVVDCFLFQADALGRDGSLVLHTPALASLYRAACQQAGRSIALLANHAPSLDQGLERLGLGAVTHLVLPSSFSQSSLDVIQQAGLRRLSVAADCIVFERTGTQT